MSKNRRTVRSAIRSTLCGGDRKYYEDRDCRPNKGLVSNNHQRVGYWPTGTRRITPAIIREIRDSILRRFRPTRIILFGSHAYGKPGPDSDVDILVIMKSRKRPAARATEVSLACHPGTISMDILVRTPGEIERLKKGFRPFWQEVLSRGKVLYEKNDKR